MKADTWQEFERLNHRIDILERKIDFLARALMTEEQLRELTADVKARAAELGAALAPK